jgi:hypothetical protein
MLNVNLPSISRLPKRIEQHTEFKEMSIILAAIVLSYEIGVVLSIGIYSGIAWSRTRQLADWINKLNDIDHDLSTICPKEWEDNKELSETVWCFAVFYIALPSLLIGSVISAFTADWNYPFYMVLVVVSSYLPNVVILAKDTNLILMFRSIEIAIRCVRNNIITFH